jgi:hypothetical protein
VPKSSRPALQLDENSVDFADLSTNQLEYILDAKELSGGNEFGDALPEEKARFSMLNRLFEDNKIPPALSRKALMRILQDRISIKSYKALTNSGTINVSTHMIDNYTDDFKVNHANLRRLWTRSNRKGGIENDIKLSEFSFDAEVVKWMEAKGPKSTAKNAPSELQSTVKHFVALIRKICPALVTKKKRTQRTIHNLRTEKWFTIDDEFVTFFNSIMEGKEPPALPGVKLSEPPSERVDTKTSHAAVDVSGSLGSLLKYNKFE